jgi:hypothetical protein
MHQMHPFSTRLGFSQSAELTRQPPCIWICRSLIKQLDRQAASICVLAADHQCERLASLAPGCSICSVGGSAASSSLAPCANMFKLTHMREVIRHIVCSHSQGGANFVVGYAMKQSRATSLTKRGFFPVAAVDGISFVPLDLTRSISEQGPFAAILHKVFPNIIEAYHSCCPGDSCNKELDCHGKMPHRVSITSAGV